MNTYFKEQFPEIEFQTPMFKWIDRETQEKILENIHPYDRDIFRFIILTGCRPGEARGLMWDCVDFNQKIIYIKRAFSDTSLRERTKTGNWRPLPITDEIGEILKMSPRTIDNHRYNIRKKLGLNNKKANLMSHLLSMGWRNTGMNEWWNGAMLEWWSDEKN